MLPEPRGTRGQRRGHRTHGDGLSGLGLELSNLRAEDPRSQDTQSADPLRHVTARRSAYGDVLIRTCVWLVFLGEQLRRKEALMPSLDQQLGPQRAESHVTRWIVVAVLVAAAVIGVVLLVLYGGGGGAGGY